MDPYDFALLAFRSPGLPCDRCDELQQRLEGIDELLKEGVLARARDSLMKLYIQSNEAVHVFRILAHRLTETHDLLCFGFGTQCSGPNSRLRFDGSAHLPDLGDTDLCCADRMIERGRHDPAIHLADAGLAAVADVDHAQRGKRPKGLAHYGPADAQIFGEKLLAGERV